MKKWGFSIAGICCFIATSLCHPRKHYCPGFLHFLFNAHLYSTIFFPFYSFVEKHKQTAWNNNNYRKAQKYKEKPCFPIIDEKFPFLHSHRNVFLFQNIHTADHNSRLCSEKYSSNSTVCTLNSKSYF